MSKRILSVGSLMVIAIGILAFASGAGQSAAPPSETIGRYQIATAPAPFARDAEPAILKLDTATGECWILGTERDPSGNRAGLAFFPIRTLAAEADKTPTQGNP